MSELTINVEFRLAPFKRKERETLWFILTYFYKSGGMELLFQNVSKHQLKFPSKNKNGNPSTLQDLIFYIRDTMMTEKKDLFVEKDTV